MQLLEIIGIITNAQTANIKSGMAALEEFLQEKYVDNYESFLGDDAPVVGLQTMFPNYFYIPTLEGIGSLRYIVDSQGHALYLIKKAGLPQEISEQLIGGNAGNGTYTDYASLNDVYGVTANLKVYYSRGTGESLLGITSDELDNDNPLREIFAQTGSNSDAYKFISDSGFDLDNNGVVTSEEVKVIKELTINNETNIDRLTDFYNLVSLQKLTIENKNLESLEGLQYCSQLNYIYIKSSTIKDYSALAGLKKSLATLYFYNIDDVEFSKIIDGIKKTNYSKLTKLAFIGNENYLDSESDSMNNYREKSEKTITSISLLDTLTSATKSGVARLFLRNNNITDELNEDGTIKKYALEGLKGFTGLNWLRIDNNNITSLKGLENCTAMAKIFANNNNIGFYDLDIKNESTDALASLKNMKSLNTLILDRNPNLKWVGYIKDLTSLRYLYLLENVGMDGDDLLSDLSVIKICGSNAKIPPEYSLLFLEDAKVISLEGQTLAEDNFKLLKGKTNITQLNLKNIKIVDNLTDNNLLNKADTNKVINEVLKTLTNMERLCLDAFATTGYSNNLIDDMSFVSFFPNLKEYCIQRTGIKNSNVIDGKECGLNLLNDVENKLEFLAVNNSEIDLSEIEEVLRQVFGEVLRLCSLWGFLWNKLWKFSFRY